MSKLIILLIVVVCTVCSAFAQYSSVGREVERADITESHTPNLATAVPDALTDALNTATEPFYGTTVRVTYVEQPAMTLIGLAQAHLLFGGGKGIIAIIDTGIDPSHPAFSQSLVPGYDFTRKTTFVSELLDLDPDSRAALTQSTVAFLDNFPAKLNQSTVAFLDQSTVAFLDTRLPVAFGHGTMVAGLAHLVAPTAKIMPLKVFRADGSANVADIVQAVYYAVDHGATVINMSFNLEAQSPDLSKAINYAATHRVICVASGGNMGDKVKLYPAGDRYVIGVGSTNHLDKRSPFSNHGVSSVTTAAPGEALVTLFPGNHYAGVWGTSFSAALVSGGVALMESMRKSGSPSDTKDAQEQGHPTYQGMGDESDIRDALEHGHPIDLGMGDGRLDLVTSLTFLSHLPID